MLLFATSPKLAAFIVLGVPATVIPILIMGRRVRGLSRLNQDRVADVSAHIDESLHEIRTVQAYGNEALARRQFNAATEAAYAAGVHRVRVKAWLISLVMLIGFCAVGVILWIGGHDVFDGRLSVGQLSAFVFYAVVVASGAGTVSEIWGEIQRAAGATERLMELLDTRPTLAAAPPQIRPPRIGARSFDEIGFAYPSRPDTTALRPVSFPSTPVSAWRWLVRRARASPRCSRCCCASTIRSRAGYGRWRRYRTLRPHDLRRAIALVPQDGDIRGQRSRQRALQQSRCQRSKSSSVRSGTAGNERLPQQFETDLGGAA